MIKPIFSLLLALCTLTTHASEQAAQNPSSYGRGITLTNARNIELKVTYDETLDNIDLWQRLRNGFTMQNTNNPLIERHEQWYTNRPDYVKRMMSRASRYLYYITSEVERRGMPGEIALLPMIESAYNPGANSTSNASGIWQFIPATGRDFGMQQNWWYDGRRDIVGATSGALDYLEKLHKQFRDWDLALAAYNWGEGSVQRAQERNRKRGLPVNYASLKLPDETRNYVPKLLAIKNIVAQPEHFGLSLPDISNTPYFLAISTAKRMDTELVAQLADISQEEFIALNPAHNRPVILQRNSDYILLPIDKIDTFQNNLESYDKPLVSWQAYHTKKGERLDNLAPRFGLSVERLKSVNGLAAQTHTSNGETLLVPLNGEENQAGGEFEAFNMHLKPPATGKQDSSSTNSIKYVTHSGDALDKLATRYHVSITTLKSWHSHTSKARLQSTSRLDRHRQAVRFHASKKHTATRSKAHQRKA